MKILKLTEYQTQSFIRDEIPDPIAEKIWRAHSAQVAVEWPTVATNHEWRLTAQGWVGFLPISPEFGLSLQPKVPLSSLFAMLEVAYDLDELNFGEGLFEAESLHDFVERLALIFARRVLSHCRRGIYRAYVPRQDRVPAVRGRIDLATQLRSQIQTPVSLQIPCAFDEQTTDLLDNQILLWTLHVLIRGGLCGERTLPTIRRAFRTLAGFTSLRPITARDCRSHLRHAHYGRLHADYRVLHSLALFILEQSTPSHQIGDQPMLPFVVNMAQLYERFVAKWLAQYVDPLYRVQAQERHNFAEQSSVRFEIDLVIYGDGEPNPICVMDTKYKVPNGRPGAADVAQVLAYAQAKNAPEALLIYPIDLPHPIDFVSNGIRVRSVTFGLEGGLFKAGQRFLGELGFCFFETDTDKNL